MWVAGISSLIGLGFTWALLPEPKGLELEEASRDQAFSDSENASGTPSLNPVPA
jgi:hypothetical protein